MSERNIELARHAFEALNAHDVEALIALCDPSIELHAALGAIDDIYHGHDGVRTWFGSLVETFDELRSEPEAYFDLGEDTLAFIVAHARGKASGAEVAMPSAWVARSRDGLAVYVAYYLHRQDALSDLGVSEDELEPIEP